MKGVLLIAKQRTGTNMLRSALSRSSDIANIGECFHTETRDGPGNFFTWFEEGGRQFPLVRTREWTVAVINEYASYVEREFAASIIDVKYNSLYALAPSWQGILQPPPLTGVFRRRGYLIIHMVRERAIEHALSQLIAASTGVYVTHEEGAIDGKEPIEINIETLLTMARGYGMEIDLVASWLRGFPNIMKLSYEGFSEGTPEVRAAVLQEICSACDGTFTSYEGPSVKRIVLDWRRCVRNVEDVEAVISSFSRRSS